MPSLLSPKPKTPRPHRSDGHTTSPSYFGLAVDPAASTATSSASRFAKQHRSPSSNVRAVVTSPPQDLPFHTGQNYSAFRRQSEKNTFSLSEGSLRSLNPSPAPKKPSPPQNEHGGRSGQTAPSKPSLPAQVKKFESAPEAEPQRVARSPKRLLSPDAEHPPTLERGRRSPPAQDSAEWSRGSGSPPARRDDKQPRLSLPPSAPISPPVPGMNRSETVPSALDGEGPSMTTPQHVANILDSHGEGVLILDLRVSTQYARARIAGALNLCIPTTLLKRASYNIQRLADSFGDAEQRTKFERWRNCKCIILYDTSSTQLKEATNCLNIWKKFASEGWQGQSYILRGGFSDFAKKFPSYVEREPGPGNAKTEALATENDGIAPVVGGCPIPASKDAANPFFGNIRQNMDLIGGVGQMEVKRPSALSKVNSSEVPSWLRRAYEEKDEGKLVSEKFYHIEKREQRRMQEALSGDVVYGTPGPEEQKTFKIAGIEKGSKNRYNNIWPYEHTRVKLEGVPANGCDYINANFVTTSLSHKKYIATQGPIPATFGDFWNVVWQRDIRVIVMLTAETEGGQVKAHNYWSGKRFGQLKLNSLSEHRVSLDASRGPQHRPRPSMDRRHSTNSAYKESSSSKNAFGTPSWEKTPSSPSSSQPHVIVRKFTLTHEGQPFERIREITQLQYSSWPDFGAPAHPAHLLGLVEQCDAVVRSSRSGPGAPGGSSAAPDPRDERPVLVHCSAGCGRTGTFCAVDSVVDMLKRRRLALARAGHGSNSNRHVSPMDIDSAANPRRFSRDGSVSADTAPDRGPEASSGDGEWRVADDVDLVEKTVEEFRLQRLSMVQSLRQFVLCYESVLEWVARQAGVGTA